jgi:hypothetical protein
LVLPHQAFTCSDVGTENELSPPHWFKADDPLDVMSATAARINMASEYRFPVLPCANLIRSTFVNAK